MKKKYFKPDASVIDVKAESFLVGFTGDDVPAKRYLKQIEAEAQDELDEEEEEEKPYNPYDALTL